MIAICGSDRSVLRDLAMRYAEITARDVQRERRDLWRRHNSLKRTRPLIYVRAFAWEEMPARELVCDHPIARQFEDRFRADIYWDSFADDSIFEPWVVIGASTITPREGVWGMPIRWVAPDMPRGGKRMDPPIRAPEDAAKLAVPHHEIDEEATARRVDVLRDAIADIIPVAVSRAPAWRTWSGDISTMIAQLRGIDQLMLDMIDRPEWLHDVLAFMRDGILKAHAEAEAAGDWRLVDHQNQAMPYAEELPDPAAECRGVRRADLWTFCASQETTCVGPAMFDEFMLDYQIPLMAPFGLTAYGCCEDLTRKIDVLRKIPNLRRIAISPMANVVRSAEQIGRDYVASYRPSPADMVSYDWNESRVRDILTDDLTALRDAGCHTDITLKDVETVQGDPDRVRRWVRVTREVIDAVWA